MDLKKALASVKNAVSGKGGVVPGPDGFPVDPASPRYSSHCLVNEFLSEVPDFRRDYEIKPNAYASGRRILEASMEERIALVEAMLERRMWVHKHDRHSFSSSFGILRKMTSLILRRELPYTAAQTGVLIATLTPQMGATHWFDDDIPPMLKICERLKVQDVLTDELQNALANLKAALKPKSEWESAERKRMREAIERLLLKELPSPLDSGEAWSNAALNDLKSMASADSGHWLELLHHCAGAESSKPTQKWMKAANQFVDAVGREEFKRRVLQWFELVALPRPVHQDPQDPRYSPDPDQLITDRNSTVLKGMAWCCAEWKDGDLNRALGRLAQVCFKKIRNLGARCPRVGNACLYSLSVTTTDEAAAELSRLNQTVKQPSTKKLIGKSLDKAAEKSGQTREELEESTVPTYGLDAEGWLKRAFGDFTAEFCIAGPGALQLAWRKADGKLQKSVPAEVKERHAAELKAFKRTMQDIEKMLPAQRQRIERLMSSEREWEFEKWRERYLDHPLLAHLSRRLIWHFRQDEQQAAGIWHEGKMVDNQDRPLEWLSAKTRVRLWHPLGQEVETVASWRRWFEMHQVAQPFKQAHREIYILTDAEVQTGTYSNRFAAHIIRQHQFAALAKERGWTYRLLGNFDSHNVPTLLLPGWDLGVEFWVNSPGGNEGTSESGIYLYLSTDQVRFCDLTGTPRLLSEVPALVFSEAMRDVDLFVGVCSVGNDPEWRDQGQPEQFSVYWYQYAFGDLSVSAKTRREVLERLLPRLKIASQCTLKDKFLIVRGSLRTYKIHLGSSNILMEPNDRYLCIVPDRSNVSSLTARNVFLPFEGDNTLAVILSKAFLLAEDAKIKDPGIVHQIGSK